MLLIALPCVVVFLVFPMDIICFLFKNGLKVGAIDEFQIASNLLRIGAFAILFIALVQVATTILQSIDKRKFPSIIWSVRAFESYVDARFGSNSKCQYIWRNVVNARLLHCLRYLKFANLTKYVKIRLSLQYDIFYPYSRP